MLRGAPAGAGGRRRRYIPWRLLLVLGVALGGAAVAVVLVVRHREAIDRQRAAAAAFTGAWTRQDARGMWTALDPASRSRYPYDRFRDLVGRADTAASVTGVRIGAATDPHDGRVAVPVALATRLFGTLRGTVTLPVGDGGVHWTPELRLPGLRRGEAVVQRTLAQPHRGQVLARTGGRLADDPVLGIFAAGLQERYRERLAGLPGAQLRFGTRIVRQVAPRSGRSVRSTMRADLQQAATAALGTKLGGVAVIRPNDGSVLALAGVAVSAPQPPGSTFKIITLAGALQAGVTSPSASFPVRTAATLSGRRLANASNEACGGSLAQSFADSCNSVFAPLGAKLGAARLVARARAFGFGEQPRIPVAKVSTLPAAADLKDDLAVGSAAIGQGKDLATALQMASVAATIGNGGIRAQPRAVTQEPVVRRRAVSAKVAGQVRDMMVGVVRSGTGTSAAIPGVPVAGKTGTAELRFTGDGSSRPQDTDAWFVAVAPARHPTVAVGVMLVGAGFGGTAAAPIAREVLQAALR